LFKQRTSNLAPSKPTNRSVKSRRIHWCTS